MATPVFGAPLDCVEGETKTLATSAGHLAVKPNFHEVKMYCASQWRLAISPALIGCYFYDTGLATYTSYRTEATDRVSTTHVPLDAMPTDDYLYLGTPDQVLGFYFNIDSSNKNDNTATLDMEYCSTAIAPGVTLAFTDVGGSDSDGTDVGGDTLKQDGVYTWGTSPGTAWKRSTLGTQNAQVGPKCYWIRFKPSATLSAAVDLIDIIPVYQNTNYGYMEPGVEYQWVINSTKCGGFVVLATAGTPTLDVTWLKHG